jgi:hypothetical protein
MAFTFKSPWAGGALGMLGKAIVALQDAMAGMKPGHFIRLDKDGDGGNSWKVSYCGTERSECWSGKIKDEAGTTLVSVDVSDPANIEGTHICYKYDTGSTEWTDAPKEDDEWGSWEVATKLDSSLVAQFGSYALSPTVRGDIIVGGSILPPATTEKNIMSVEMGTEALEWQEAALSINASTTGFEFVKPSPAELSVHSQMKATGGAALQVLTRTIGGAVWDDPKFTMLSDVYEGDGWGLTWTKNTSTLKLTHPAIPQDVVTGVTADLEVVAGPKLRLTLHVTKSLTGTTDQVCELESSNCP